MYPFSVKYCCSPEHGVLVTSIGDLTNKISVLLFTLLSAREIFKISILLHLTSREVIICYYFYYISTKYMIPCTDTCFIHESSNGIILNSISFNKSILLPTNKNKPISTKIHQNHYHFISAAISEQPG